MTVTTVMSLAWGVSIMVLFGYVFVLRLHAYRVHHDKRALREVLVGLGLFLLGAASMLSILAVVTGVGRPAAVFFGAVAWGAVLGVAVLLAAWSPRNE